MPRSQLNVRLPDDVLAQARKIAEQTGRTVTELVELGLRREIGMEPSVGTANPAVNISSLDGRLARLERLAEDSGAL